LVTRSQQSSFLARTSSLDGESGIGLGRGINEVGLTADGRGKTDVVEWTGVGRAMTDVTIGRTGDGRGMSDFGIAVQEVISTEKFG